MKVRVRAKNDKFEFECREGESVLYAGLRNGLALPYECATGTCGTCKARVREPATIEEGWIEAPGNFYLKRDRGEFLMCQTCARGDCEVAVPASVDRAPEGTIPPAWTQGRIRNLRQLTHDVIAFSLEVDDPMDFEAGQFAVVQVPQVQGFRAYSMVNYAHAARSLEFVVKKKPDGAFSDWLFAPDADGTEAAVFGPLGNAIFRPEDDKDVLCIAGGSGIAGMMSILARGCRDGYFKSHKGNLFFGVRTMKDVFFLDELSAFAAAYPDNLRVTIALSDEDVPADNAHSNGAIDFANGFVHAVASERMSGRYDDITAFIAGPPPMVDGAIRMLIIDARLPASRVRYDKFS
ncbi:MAG: 2Fe-2S iron-sulfur cluster-binding protein [Methyloligellaceae bacterium]